MQQPRVSARLALLGALAALLTLALAYQAASARPTEKAASTSGLIAQRPSSAQTLVGLSSVPRNQTLVVSPWYLASTISNPTTFNIYAPGDLSQHGIGNKTIYEGLAYYVPTTGKSVPWLATNWRYSNNYKTLTVDLRRGVTWSDGVPFTSQDVKFTFDMLKANAPTLQYSSAIKSSVASVTTPNALTVVFHLTKSDPRWVKTYVTVGFENHIVPVPEHIWKGKNPKTFTNENIAKGWPVGTGPYKLVSAGPYQQVFDENPNYWGSKTGFTNLPAPKRIVMVPGASDQALAQLYIGNKIDTGYALQPTTFTAAHKQNSALGAWNTNGPVYGAVDGCADDLVFNNAIAPWNNKNVRLAINYALNRQQVASLAFSDATSPEVAPFSSYISGRYVTGTDLGSVIASYNRNHQDLSQVAKYMNAAGFTKDSNGIWASDGKELEVPVTGPQGLAPVAPVVVAQLKAAGFAATENIQADNSSWSTQFLNGQLGGVVFFVYCGSLTEPYETLSGFASSQSAPIGQPCPSILTCTRYSNPQFDSLINQMALIPNPSPTNKKYMNLVTAATRIYLEDMPAIMLVEERWVVPYSTKYWMGWPTLKNPYQAPFPSWEGWNLILHKLQPAK